MARLQTALHGRLEVLYSASCLVLWASAIILVLGQEASAIGSKEQPRSVAAVAPTFG